MSGMNWIFGLIVLLIILFVALYNKLAKQKVMVEEASSDIETFLKQRYDMIPNLIEIVKGYAKHEKDIFTDVTNLRAKAMSTDSLEEKLKYDAQLKNGISKLFAVAENYPELKANQNFIQLHQSLENLENEIQKARRYYNGTARDFNEMIVVFPNNIIAGILNFKKVPFFEASEEEKKNVEVKF
ncbi:MAG TPA: LemA family protein [Candidatus Dojkabacteria bacterium]|jgi:LemA protein|nr:LemA family protein [Candidatus Dojkabacteria bacterium]